MTPREIVRPRDRSWRFSWIVLRCETCFNRRLAFIGGEFPPCRFWNCPDRSDS